MRLRKWTRISWVTRQPYAEGRGMAAVTARSDRNNNTPSVEATEDCVFLKKGYFCVIVGCNVVVGEAAEDVQ